MGRSYSVSPPPGARVGSTPPPAGVPGAGRGREGGREESGQQQGPEHFVAEHGIRNENTPKKQVPHLKDKVVRGWKRGGKRRGPFAGAF